MRGWMRMDKGPGKTHNIIRVNVITSEKSRGGGRIKHFDGCESIVQLWMRWKVSLKPVSH